MIYGIGVDLASIDHFRQLLADPATHFLATHFTAGELAYARAHDSEDPARHLAARYAVKEAVVKAMRASFPVPRAPSLPLQSTKHEARSTEVNFREIEVVSHVDGAPRLVFHGQVAERVKAVGIQQAHLSLSHDAGVAVAMVVLEK